MQERISPTTDLAFKKVLGSEESKDILAGFIEDFELGKGKIETTNQKHWRDYFTTGSAGAKAPEHIKKASKVIEYINLTEEERNMSSTLERLEANEQAERYYIATTNRTEGKKEGIKETEKKAYNEKLGVAKSLLGVLDAETIAQKFNIPIEEITT
jgi:hypothetical protein